MCAGHWLNARLPDASPTSALKSTAWVSASHLYDVMERSHWTSPRCKLYESLSFASMWSGEIEAHGPLNSPWARWRLARHWQPPEVLPGVTLHDLLFTIT